MRRFILVDPCLTDHGSHPVHYCLDVLAAADRAGFACEAVAHTRFLPPAGVWPERFGLSPVLDIDGHSKYTAFGELDRLTPDGSPRLRLSAPWAARHAEQRRRERIAAFAEAMAPIVSRVRAGDIVLLATASELDVAGLSRAIRAAEGTAGVGWHALFHYPLYRGLAPDFPRQERRLDRIRGLLTEALAGLEPQPIHIHVTTAELAAQYVRLGVGPIGVLPYPVRAISRPPRPNSGRPLRVVVLGNARPEKGSQHLADVVDRAAAEPGLAGRLAFAIQSNTGCPPGSRKADDRAVLDSLRRLSERARRPREPEASPPMVELIPGPLVGSEYDSQLATADISILPYDQDRYHSRCSAVLLESLAAGVVPIVTGGGWMGRLVGDQARMHVDDLLARSRLLATERYPAGSASGDRPWQVAVTPSTDATALVVTLRHRTSGPDAVLAVPATVRLDGGGAERAAALLAADVRGHGAAVILPLSPEAVASGPLRLCIGPADPGHTVEFVDVAVSVIDSGSRPPLAAVGIVVPPDGNPVNAIVAALREIVEHADHYAASAYTHAASVAARYHGDRVVETLVAITAGIHRPDDEALHT